MKIFCEKKFFYQSYSKKNFFYESVLVFISQNENNENSEIIQNIQKHSFTANLQFFIFIIAVFTENH